MPENLTPLYNNIALNRFSNIEVNEVALSNHSGSLDLYVPSDHQQGSSGCTRVCNPGGWVSVGTTPVTTLDLVFQKERLDFIKIDTEGHELKILEGAKSTIERFRPFLLCEISEENRNQAFNLFKSWDYAIFSVTSNGSLSESIASSGWIDVFLIPQEKISKIEHLLN